MISLLADENIEAPIVEHLRKRGYDLLTARDLGLSFEPDPVLLAQATDLGRVILTHDRDFIVLHKSGATHAGIIFTTYDPDFTALADRIHDAIQRCLSIAGTLVRVYRPS